MKWFVPPLAPMTEEVKEILIREHPNAPTDFESSSTRSSHPTAMQPAT